MRRLRKTGVLRDMVRETELSPKHFVYPMFVELGIDFNLFCNNFLGLFGAGRVGIDFEGELQAVHVAIIAEERFPLHFLVPDLAGSFPPHQVISPLLLPSMTVGG